MLQALRVEQFAIIDQLSVEFMPGLNVITGETGAGKSLLVDALGLALGGRARAAVIRRGAEEAVVEALFRPTTPQSRAALDASLEARGLPVDDGVLLAKRVVSRSGRHRVYVNGGLATAALLGEVARSLVDLCGQHEHMALQRPGAHLKFLDEFLAGLGPARKTDRDEYREAWEVLRRVDAEAAALEQDTLTRRQREDFVRFQLGEIDALSPVEGEIEKLEGERRTLRHAGALREATAAAQQALYEGERSVVDILGGIGRTLREVLVHDPGLEPFVAGLEEALAITTELSRDLGRYAGGPVADPARLDELEERLSDLLRLARKHGGSVEAVLQTRTELEAELEDLENHDERARVVAEEAIEAREVATRVAERLTAARRQGVGRLDAEMATQLPRLGLRDSRFRARLSPFENLGPDGAETVCFELSAGPDEAFLPVGQVASGGELSRLLLALRQCRSGTFGAETLVFDEVDAGIGGAAGDVVGALLARAASRRQVLCVTHLPQVAVHAGWHLVVRKGPASARSRVEVLGVEGSDRRDEIARMLGGARLTDRSRDHAEEMIASAGKRRGRTGRAQKAA